MRRSLLLLLIVLLAGCNLENDGSATLAPTLTAYVPPTPYRAPTLVAVTPLALGAQQAAVTPSSGNLLTPVPAQTLIEQPQPPPAQQNVIEAFINNLIIPAWNFIYTLVLTGVSTMWLFAGARGGVFAQVFCCIVPAGVIVGAVILRLRIIRLR